MTHTLNQDFTIHRRGGKKEVLKKGEKATIISLHDQIAIVKGKDTFSINIKILDKI